MRVFILCTGRTGSVSISKACSHITNFTSGHETQSQVLNLDARLDFPDNHIEADNRLSWFLGGLEKRYGKEAFYVHLKRDEEKTAQSFTQRFDSPVGIMSAYCSGVLMKPKELLNEEERLEVCRNYVRSTNENIAAFLNDKPLKMELQLEQIQADFEVFWKKTGAKGDFEAALNELKVRHNESKPESYLRQKTKYLLHRIKRMTGV